MANDSRMLSGSRGNKKVDKNELYTLYEDIVAELNHYRDQFRGKRVICPCDWDESLEEICVFASEEAVQSGSLFGSGAVKTIDVGATGKIEKDLGQVRCNFVKFLIAHADAWGIASISVSGYNPATGEGVKFQDVNYSKYDICVTNPPFSLFREFVDTMFNWGIKFLVIGPQTAITHKNVFPRLMNGEMWLGYHYHMAGFIRPDGSRVNKQDNLARSCGWYTNMPVSYRNNFLPLDREYDPVTYPRFDNFDAIYVPETMDIPYDYDGVMGVPITFMQKYCPEQFKIIGIAKRGAGDPALWTKRYTKADYPNYSDLNASPTLLDENGVPYNIFPRILIKRR